MEAVHVLSKPLGRSQPWKKDHVESTVQANKMKVLFLTLVLGLVCSGVSENMRVLGTGTDWFTGGSDGSCHRGKPLCLCPSGKHRDACGVDGKAITAAVTC